jgi:hypothetical protein
MRVKLIPIAVFDLPTKSKPMMPTVRYEIPGITEKRFG